MDRDQLRIEALKLAHADIFPGIKGDSEMVIQRATAYARWLLTEHDTDAKGPDYLIRQQHYNSLAATQANNTQFPLYPFNKQGDAAS